MRLHKLQLALATFATLALTGALGCAGGAANTTDDDYVTVCKDQVMTGSHVGRVRCHRKRDVAERQRRDRALMQHMQSERVRQQRPMQPAGN